MLDWNIIGIAGGRSRIHSGGDPVEMQTAARPLRVALDHQRYSAARKILLNTRKHLVPAAPGFHYRIEPSSPKPWCVCKGQPQDRRTPSEAASATSTMALGRGSSVALGSAAHGVNGSFPQSLTSDIVHKCR